MIPVVFALSAWLPNRRLMWITQLVGLPALAVLTVRWQLVPLFSTTPPSKRWTFSGSNCLDAFLLWLES